MNYIIISTGKSMIPLFNCIERISIKPYINDEIRSGDIILFSPKNTSKQIIHRVISNKNNEIKTKGDNNSKIDPWVISKSQVIGKAEHIVKNNKFIKIHGGKIGLIQSYYFQCITKINNILRLLFFNFFIKLSKLSNTNKLIKIILKIKCVKIKYNNQTNLILTARNKTIGKFVTESKKWHIKIPYRFFINEKNISYYVNIDI